MGYRKAAKLRRRQSVRGHYRTSKNDKTYWVEDHIRNNSEDDFSGCLWVAVILFLLIIWMIMAAYGVPWLMPLLFIIGFITWAAVEFKEEKVKNPRKDPISPQEVDFRMPTKDGGFTLQQKLSIVARPIEAGEEKEALSAEYQNLWATAQDWIRQGKPDIGIAHIPTGSKQITDYLYEKDGYYYMRKIL